MSAHRPALLLTRPADAAQAFWGTLPASFRSQVDCVISPLIGYRATGSLPDLGGPDGPDGIVLTSQLGVRALTNAMTAPRPAHTHPQHLPKGLVAYCVGRTTAAAAEQAGLTTVCADGDAQALISLISSQAPGARLVHIRGTHSRGDVARQLTQRGLPTSDCVLYDQPAIPLTDAAVRLLNSPSAVIAPLFSPRTAELFADAHPGKAELTLVCMSPAVFRAAQGITAGMRRIARHPSADYMRDAVAEAAQAAGLLEGGL